MAIQNERLTAFVQRIERLMEEKAGIAGDIKEVFAEAKSAGYDTKVMRILLRERKMDRADLQEQRALLDVYREALGMLADTPLGSASVRKAMDKFVDGIPADTSVTISTPGTEGVTIAKDAKGRVIRRGVRA